MRVPVKRLACMSVCSLEGRKVGMCMQYSSHAHAHICLLVCVCVCVCVFHAALTGCFIVEFLIKHIGLGYVRYWSDPWNDLDGIIVIISIVDIILTYALAGSQTGAMQVGQRAHACMYTCMCEPVARAINLTLASQGRVYMS